MLKLIIKVDHYINKKNIEREELEGKSKKNLEGKRKKFFNNLNISKY